MVNPKYNYYGVSGDWAWHLPSHSQFEKYKSRPAIFRASDTVWLQGPKGGVRIIYSNNIFQSCGYITQNEEAMKKFFWVKLKAECLVKT